MLRGGHGGFRVAAAHLARFGHPALLLDRLRNFRHGGKFLDLDDRQPGRAPGCFAVLGDDGEQHLAVVHDLAAA
jgi:hypothetical protein